MDKKYNPILAFAVVAFIGIIMDRFDHKVAKSFLWAILIIVLMGRWPVLSKMIGGE